MLFNGGLFSLIIGSFKRTIGTPINWMLQLYDHSKTFKNGIICLKLGPFWQGKTFGDMVGRCMPNSGNGGCPGNRFMTIFGSHVQLHISHIGYMRVYEGLQALEGISSFSREI